MKKVLCFILVFLLIISVNCSLITYAYDSKYTINTEKNVSSAFKQKNLAGNTSYTNFIYSIRDELSTHSTKESRSSKYTVNGIAAGEYPNYYSGAYTNSSGNLVALINSNQSHTERRDAIQDFHLRAQSEDIIIAYADYSYNELISIMDTVQKYIVEHISSGKNDIYDITGASIDDYQNRVIIYLNELSESSIEWFKQNVIDSDATVFAEKKDYDIPAATANCGDAITSNNKTFSLGFRAKRTLSSGTVINGFITCGHAFYNVTTNIEVRHGTNLIGYLDSSRNRCSGIVDAAFVTLSTGSEINSKVVTDYVTYNIGTAGWILPTVGSTVYMYGQKSASAIGTVRVGVIQSTSDTTTYDLNGDGIVETYLSDLVRASYTTLTGDSGGVVFAYSGAYYVTGTVSGFDPNSTASSTYTKALNIMDVFDVSPR